MIKFLLVIVAIIIIGGGLYLFLSGQGSKETGQPTRLTSTPASSNIWIPAPTSTFQWQLEDKLDQEVETQVFDIDLFNNDKSVVDALHQKNRKVICYISVGSWENWRPDANAFPKEVIGKVYQGFEDEKWLDIRKIDLLAPVIQTRLDQCKEKGFDGIEPDNIDGYQNDTGFPLTYSDQLKFNIWLSEEAHKRGLSIGLKNDPDQVKDLIAYFDWALTEDCFVDSWCGEMEPFIKEGKAVFQTEYTDQGVKLEDFCPDAKKRGFSAILKNRNLDAFHQFCD